MSVAPSLSDRLAARETPAGTPLARKRQVRRLLLHWSWDPSALQRALPQGLTVDTYKGRAWVGLSVLAAKGVVPAFCPAVFSLNELSAVSVRTYVFDSFLRPGVFILRLDLGSWPALFMGRLLFDMASEKATITCADFPDESTDVRVRMFRPAAGSHFLHRRLGELQTVALESGTLEAFLLERYRLFTMDRTATLLKSAAVAHPQSLQSPVELVRWDDVCLRRAGFDRSGRLPEHVCEVQTSFEHLYPMSEVPEADPVLDPSVLGDSAMPA
jgi:uncharacterized protein YqjF (DUF2071 family)